MRLEAAGCACSFLPQEPSKPNSSKALFLTLHSLQAWCHVCRIIWLESHGLKVDLRQEHSTPAACHAHSLCLYSCDTGMSWQVLDNRWQESSCSASVTYYMGAGRASHMLQLGAHDLSTPLLCLQVWNPQDAEEEVLVMVVR